MSTLAAIIITIIVVAIVYLIFRAKVLPEPEAEHRPDISGDISHSEMVAEFNRQISTVSRMAELMGELKPIAEQM